MVRSRLWLVLAALALLVACSKSNTTTAAATTEAAPEKAAEPARYVRVALEQEPETLDPALIHSAYSIQVISNLWEGLYSWHPQTAEPVAELAKSYDLSKDGRTYTFKLREDAKWSDGKPVTAGDFVYAWRRAVDPATSASYGFFLYSVKNGKAINKGEIKDVAQLGVKALDDYTLQVELNEPTPYFTALLCLSPYFPVPQWAVEQHGNKWTHTGNSVSNGPFMLKEWKPREHVTIERNPYYWGAKDVQVAGVKYLPIEDHDTALRMYNAGELDVAMKVPDMKIPDLAKNHPDYVKAPWLGIYYYRLNVTNPALKDVRVRRALGYAIDREALTGKFLQDAHVANASMVPSGLNGYANAKGLEYNPEKARQLLAEAGYPNGEGFPKLEILYNTQEQHKLVAQVIQQMWKQELGVDASLLNQEWKTYSANSRALNYSVSRAGWIGDYADPNTFLDYFTTGNPQNWTGWGSAEFDEYIAKAAAETNPQQRFNYLTKAEQIILDEAPIVPIFTYTKHFLVKPELKGYYGNVQDQHAMKGVYFADTAAVKK